MNTPNDSAAFGGDDRQEESFRDERVLQILSTPKAGSWAFGPGKSYFLIMPSSGDWQSFFPARPREYAAGIPFTRITVKCKGNKKARYFRTPKNNPLTQAYWDLREKLKGEGKAKSPEWDAVYAGFKAGGEYRRALNVVPMRAGGVMCPHMMILNTPDKTPGDVVAADPADPAASGKKPSLYEMCYAALLRALALNRATNPNAGFPFDPKAAILFEIVVTFQDTMPQYQSVEPYLPTDPVTKMQKNELRIFDASALWEASDKDQAVKYAKEVDELPELAQCETIASSQAACAILNLNPAAFAAAPQGHQRQGYVVNGPVTPPAGAQTSATNPAVTTPAQHPAGYTPQAGAPSGFGPTATPSTAAAVAGTPTAPATAPAVVNPASSVQTVAAGFGAALDARLGSAPAVGTIPPAGTTSVTPPADNPPF